jgi:hypothetical protein
VVTVVPVDNEIDASNLQDVDIQVILVCALIIGFYFVKNIILHGLSTIKI